MIRSVTECDRCREIIPDADRKAARAYVATRDGQDILGEIERAADLCARCVRALDRFLFDPSIADDLDKVEES